jgi:hypothetical protein
MEWNNSVQCTNPEAIVENIISVFEQCLPFNTAVMNPDGRHYEIRDGVRGPPLKARIHSSSFLAAARPPLILFTKLTFDHGKNLYMKNCGVLRHVNPRTKAVGAISNGI